MRSSRSQRGSESARSGSSLETRSRRDGKGWSCPVIGPQTGSLEEAIGHRAEWVDKRLRRRVTISPMPGMASHADARVLGAAVMQPRPTSGGTHAWEKQVQVEQVVPSWLGKRRLAPVACWHAASWHRSDAANLCSERTPARGIVRIGLKHILHLPERTGGGAVPGPFSPTMRMSRSSAHGLQTRHPCSGPLGTDGRSRTGRRWSAAWPSRCRPVRLGRNCHLRQLTPQRSRPHVLPTRPRGPMPHRPLSFRRLRLLPQGQLLRR